MPQFHKGQPSPGQVSLYLACFHYLCLGQAVPFFGPTLSQSEAGRGDPTCPSSGSQWLSWQCECEVMSQNSKAWLAVRSKYCLGILKKFKCEYRSVKDHTGRSGADWKCFAGMDGILFITIRSSVVSMWWFIWEAGGQTNMALECRWLVGHMDYSQ